MTVLQLPMREDWLLSVDLVRVDGKLRLRLRDATMSFIEAEPTDPAEKLNLIANLIEDSLGTMRADASALRK